MESPRDSPAPQANAQLSPWARLLRARGEWAFVIVTAALTSAGVSVLTMWLTRGGSDASNEWVGAVTVSYEPLEAVPAVEVGEPSSEEAAPVPDATPASDPPESPAAVRRPAARAVRTVRPSRRVDTPTSTPSGPLVDGRFAVVTVPDGANVTINGVGYGTTPLTIPYLAPGVRRIRITKPGYQTEERVLGGEASRSTPSLRIVLRETAGPRGAQ